MRNPGVIIALILNGVAVAMSVATIVLIILDAADLDSYVTLLVIGLFTLAVAALQGVKVDQSGGKSGQTVSLKP